MVVVATEIDREALKSIFYLNFVKTHILFSFATKLLQALNHDHHQLHFNRENERF
jgi:hypothetical protein